MLALLHFTCMAMLTVNGWILHLIFTPCSSVLLLSVGPCVHLTLCLSALFYHILFIHMAFLLYTQILCSCCLLTTWKCVPLLDLLPCYAQDQIAYHLHPILRTSDAITACTSVTLFFPLGVRSCLKKKNNLFMQRVWAVFWMKVLHHSASNTIIHLNIHNRIEQQFMHRTTRYVSEITTPTVFSWFLPALKLTPHASANLSWRKLSLTQTVPTLLAATLIMGNEDKLDDSDRLSSWSVLHCKYVPSICVIQRRQLFAFRWHTHMTGAHTRLGSS